ncbi:MAG: 4Fe-4S ferredoxin [Deltaproteobacteria bacterium]|nr:MAG: 4Fe-4S ferredoxin [Deltaproteobacteria bacterium]
MSNLICPVNNSVIKLKEMLDSSLLKDPKCRRISEELLELLEDIAWGRAGKDHIPAIESLAKELVAGGPDDVCVDVGAQVQEALAEHLEVFVSHVETHNCSSGACIKLAPAPCQMACPAGIDIPSYVTLIGMGHDAEAIEIIRKDNPFPWVCGLVCTRPCEFMCVRGRIDKPISIKFLKAFAAERALSQGRYRNPDKMPDKNKKVAIIGAGPAGMSAAYYLALMGYTVSIIESLPMAGGMMMVGIPRYRLPREVIDREAAMIQELGVEIRFNTAFGKDITIDQLKKEGFEAFLFAIGAHKAFALGIPGEKKYPQMIKSIDLLRNVALGDRKIPGKKVIVIGGGNVAIDAARTCIRLGCEEVTIAYRRTHSEMPADIEEVEQAEEEGIRMSFLTVPVEVIGENGKITSLHCLRAELTTREGSDRKYPVPVDGSDFFMEADAIIPAIGQAVDRECLENLSEIKWTRRSTIHVNRACMETTMKGVFSAGDSVLGPATVVEAIGGGKKAADAIDRYLSGIPQPKLPPVPVRRGRIDFIEVPASTKMNLKKPDMPLLNFNRRRITFQQVELGYSENVAREEARRCLRCDICRRCGACVEVCRDKMGINALNLGYLDFDKPFQTDFRDTADRCIVCGACAENCPNDAMQIKDVGDERILSICGTTLNRLKLEYCDICGEALGPAKYHDYISKRLNTLAKVADDRTICVACSRKMAAKQHNEEIIPLR